MVVSSEEAQELSAGEGGRRRLYADARHWSAIRQWFFPLPNSPVPAPLDREELRSRRDQVHLDAAGQLLEEAQTVWDARMHRIQAAEAKATTLLGTVAIAASLIIAGAGLILDPSRVASGWREVLMGLVFALLASLLMCGAMASRALLKVHLVSRPQVRQALQRAASSDPRHVQLDRALDLMARSGENRYVADYKLAQIRAAHRWYRLSLSCFFLFGVVIAGYTFSGDLPG